jgi:hypothetical protein
VFITSYANQTHGFAIRPNASDPAALAASDKVGPRGLGRAPGVGQRGLGGKAGPAHVEAGKGGAPAPSGWRLGRPHSGRVPADAPASAAGLGRVSGPAGELG